MASLKPCIKTDYIKIDKKCNIKIRVSHDKKVRYISTPWDIEPKYMNADGTISPKYPGQAKLNLSINLLLAQYNNIMIEQGPDIVYMDINSLIAKLKAKEKHGTGFLAYMRKRVMELERENRWSYASSFQLTVGHIESFTGRKEIQFNEITVGFLTQFEGYLRQVRGVKVNTVRIYIKNIRAVLYHAIDAEIVRIDISPFRKFKIGQEKTRKRSLDIKELQTLLSLRPSVTIQQQRAIDIFFLIFYLCGINLKDLLFLTPGSIDKGRLHYRRFKTGRLYSIKIFSPAMEIIERYRGEKYLLRFMDEKEKITPQKRMHLAAADILHQVNKLLKTVIENAKLDMKVTTYSARYSWATIASKLGISRDIISHALGHGIDTVSDTYIDFDLSKVDRANERIINKLIAVSFAGNSDPA